MSKKIISLLLSLFCFVVLYAQQIPNSDFEKFEKDALNNGVGERPVGWNASNIYKSVLGVEAKAVLVSQDKNGRNGKCVRARNAEVGAAGVYEISPAWFTLGKPWNFIKGVDTGSATAGTDGGINFTFRPDTLVVWIKRTYDNKENSRIVFYSWKGTSRGDSYKNKNGGCSSTTHYDEESDIRRQNDGNACGTTTLATQIAEGSWVSAEQYKEWTEVKMPITYFSNEKPEKVNIIIAAANYPDHRSTAVNNNSAIWADDLRLIYSSSIDELYLDGRKKLSAKNGVFDYSCLLGKTATSVGEITLKRSGRFLDPSEYTITKGGIGEVTKIEVRAEDGSSVSTYNITFAAEMSKNANISNIKIGGISVKGFKPMIYDYDVELPYGTTACPDVEVETAEEGQTYSVSKPSSLPGLLRVTTTAPDGATTKDYNINLSVGSLTDNTLLDIKVGGNSIPNFVPATNNYTVELPLGTTEVPNIEYVTAYPDDHIIVIDNKGIDGGVTISVTPKGTTLTRVYKLKFIVTESTYSLLKSIMLDGVEIPDFSSGVFSYDVNLPIGTEKLPVITFVKGDNYQTVTIEDGGMDGTTKIVVVAQSGAQSIYRINFAVKKSSISTLRDILLDGVSLEEFSPDNTVYTVNLPIGTTTVPEITVEKGDEFQDVTITKGGINAESRIVVVAQSGDVTTYKIKFLVAQSSNTKLKEIKLDGKPLKNFNPDVTAYDILLPRGTEVLPEITWTVGDNQQIVRKSEGGVNGETKITVKAQSGDVNVYLLRFSVETNSNVNLNNIYLDGTPLENFTSDNLEYYVELPSGTTAVPDITFDKADDGQTVLVTKGGVNGKTQVLVRAEDGTTRIYVISFSVKKSENAFLKMIFIDGKPLEGFEPTKLEYSLDLSPESISCPKITVESDPSQQISVVVPLLTGLVRIEVTPQSGSKNVYTIRVDYKKSDNSALKSISVDGKQLVDFNPDKHEYSIVLPSGTTQLPLLAYEKQEECQSVYYEPGNINDCISHLYVKSEKGSVSTYTIRFTIPRSGDSQLSNLLIDGVSVKDFQPDKTDYEFILSDEVLSLPEISYELGNPAQNVTLISPQLDGVAKIIVLSEDSKSTTTYTINFKYQISNSLLLDSVVLDQPAIKFHKSYRATDFDESDQILVDWTDGLPAPDVTYYSGSANQKVALADAKLNGTEILVVAPDGSQRKYEVRYNIIKSKSALLKDIMLYDNGKFVSLSEFRSDKFSYEVSLPFRTVAVPVISPVRSFAGQEVEIRYGGVNETTIISVKSDDKQNTQEYKIKFTLSKSSVSSLSAIYYNDPAAGQREIEGFRSDVYKYLVELPYGTKQTPVLTWDLGRESNGEIIYEQNIEYNAGSLNDSSVIKVTAEDGTFQNYVVKYSVARSSEANRITNLAIGNTLVPLQEGEYNYIVELPYGTNKLPVITYDKSYDEQLVLVSSKGILGGTSIKVYADNEGETGKKAGTDFVEYNIRYKVSKQHPLSIRSLEIGGINKDLEPGYYDHIVPVVETPTVDNLIINTDAVHTSVVMIDAKKALVKTYDGAMEDSLVYNFYFQYPSDLNADIKNNNRLASVSVNGVPLSNFSPTQTDYQYNLSAEQTELPVIEVRGEIDEQQHRISFSEEENQVRIATISSMSINGSVKEYKIAFNRGISTEKRLQSILVGGEPLADFIPDKTSYKYNVPALYGHIPDIQGVGMNYNQSITYSFQGNDRLVIVVRPEKRIERNIYTIDFVEETNSNIQLNNIVIEGTDFVFDKNKKDYTLNLNDNVLPFISFEKSFEGQSVVSCITNAKATFDVTAYDGTSKDRYTINFLRPSVGVSSQLSSLLINDVALPDFSKDKYLYHYNIDLGPIETVSFTTESYAVQVQQSVNADSIIVKVIGKDINSYVVKIDRTVSGDAQLSQLLFNGQPISGFVPSLNDYPVNVQRRDYPHLRAETNNRDAKISVRYDSVAADSFIFDVTAQDGTEKSTNVVLNRVRSVDNTLDGIFLNGELLAIEGKGYTSSASFTPENREYDITLHSATPKFSQPDMPSIAVSSADYGQDVVIENGGINGDTYVTVRSESGVENMYKLAFSASESSDAHLKDLAVNYVSLPDFDPSVFTYEVRIGRYDNLPEVTYVESDAFQKVRVNKLDDKIEVEVTAEDGTKAVYEINIIKEISSSAKLYNIIKDGEPLADFDPEVFDYFFNLPVGTQTEPMLSVVSGADGQQISIVSGGVNGVTKIDVVAEDGLEKRQYRIHYNLLLSENNKLDMIYLNGDSLSVGMKGCVVNQSFSPTIRDYEVLLPIASELPIVTYQPGDEFQTVDLTIRPDGTHVITVTPQRESLKYEYIIRFIQTKSRNSHLSSIEVDGVALSDFDPEMFNYVVNLPVGTEKVPYISYTSGDSWQRIKYTEASTLKDVSVIRVEAQDTTYVSCYFIRFNRLLSSVNTLKAVYLNGVALEGFRPDSFEYKVMLPVGTTEMPQIEYVSGDSYQKIQLINSGIYGGYTIVVEAEDGATNVYSVKFDIQKSDNSLLKSILVGGEPLEEFDPEIFDYELSLPYGTREVPMLMYKLSDVSTQTIDYTPAKTLNDTASFSVVAEDGVSKSVYRVWFVCQKSDNALLEKIFIGGEPISLSAKGFVSDKEFSSEEYMYNILLPHGTAKLPEITYKGQVEDYFSIVVSGDSVNGTTIITVTSADERNVRDYTINFSVRKNSNALLKQLKVAGDLLKNFKDDQFAYTIEFPIGTDTLSLPEADDVVYEKYEDTQIVTVTQSSETEILVLVTAEDGETQNVYSVRFDILLSSNVLLSDIKIGGVSLASFSPTQYEYVYYVLPGVELPEVTVVKSEDSQSVDITVAHVGEPTEIFVEAEDGSVGVYRILFKTTEDNPFDTPTVDDVAWTPMGDGAFKASSTRDGVQIMIYKIDGSRVISDKVQLIDPNEDIRLPHQGGTVIHLDRKGQWYIYVFVYKNFAISSGKFIY